MIKEHSFVTGIINKSERTTDEHEDLIKVKPQVALVKDLVTSDIEDSFIIFCVVSTNIVTAKNKGPISGTPVVSVKIGDHNYYGICDLESNVSLEARLIEGVDQEGARLTSFCVVLFHFLES